jgi:hypothetical protein
MVYTIHRLLYTICYAGHTTVYLIGIYHGILNDIDIRIYHGIYHNIFSSFISHWTRASPQAAALEEISGPTARVLSLAQRAADRGS